MCLIVRVKHLYFRSTNFSAAGEYHQHKTADIYYYTFVQSLKKVWTDNNYSDPAFLSYSIVRGYS